MNIYENLTLFQELISCSHQLYLWHFSPDMNLRYTNCPDELIDGYRYFLTTQTQPLLSYAANGGYPLIMDTLLNILWIADFHRQENTLAGIYIMGPVFTGNYSYQRVKNNLEHRDFSAKTLAEVMKQVEQIPIIPSNLLFQYAVMLHYCISGEKISYKHFHFSSSRQPGSNLPAQDSHKEHTGIWASEQILLNMVRNGNDNYMDALSVSSTLSSGIRYGSEDSLREAKNNGLVLLVLVSRASIEGGLTPDTSYTLCDYYARRLEDADNMADISILCQTLLDDYIQRVRNSKKHTGISQAVLSCCDYIATHLSENLSLSYLASRAGYTEYYFSRKFKRETGIGMPEYINRKKMQQAQILLSSTTMSILEIGMELGFSSRSYFADTFKKTTGISPGEYRKRHFKM